MLKDKLVAGVFFFDLFLIFLWAMLFFWHVMLGLAILVTMTVSVFAIYEGYKALHYVDDRIIHHQ